MRTRGTTRWSAACVAGLAALTLGLGLAGGPHRAGALLRGLPRTAVTVGHAADVKGLPLAHRVGKSLPSAAAIDATLAPALLSVALVAAVTAGVRRRRPRALIAAASRSRAPPARH